MVLVILAGASAFGSLLAENAELEMQCQVADVIQQAQCLPVQGREWLSILRLIC
jgi:hypothetical protein